MRKRKLPPDTRLDWRDPNMPVSVCADGIYELWSPKDWQALARSVMNDYDTCPNFYADENWRNDPTYNMRVRK